MVNEKQKFCPKERRDCDGPGCARIEDCKRRRLHEETLAESHQVNLQRAGRRLTPIVPLKPLKKNEPGK